MTTAVNDSLPEALSISNTVEHLPVCWQM